MYKAILMILLMLGSALTASLASAQVYVRYNQLPLSKAQQHSILFFSATTLPSEPEQKGLIELRGKSWGRLEHFKELMVMYKADKVVQISAATSQPVSLQFSDSPYADLPDALLEYMRQQRCGHNPWLDEDCHTTDGRTAYGPLPAGTPIDASGGWHDAGDMLKYLLTSEVATAHMLLAYVIDPKQKHADALLDEARWGVTWMLKLHPTPETLYDQVGDDRDHVGFRDPAAETADYGFGKGGPRVVYCADGKPQGLGQFKNDSTGMANLAGTYAAAMALSYQIWKDKPNDEAFAAHCLQAAKEVYQLGVDHPGVQQGNCFREPYHYSPAIWAGAMEWAAAELFRCTGDARYLDDAKKFARQSAGETFMGKTEMPHYQFFPFVNAGHFRLYDLAPDMQKFLADDYADGLRKCQAVAEDNPFGVGVPFVWCSNNLVVGLATQCELYRRMTGDKQFDRLEQDQIDWLLGRNPWGTTMITGVGTTCPIDAHLMTVQRLHRPVRGGLVDGPVYSKIFQSLKGVYIREPDPLADFQGPAVYHDDGHDYSSNEPTIDGSASAILMFGLCNAARD